MCCIVHVYGFMVYVSKFYVMYMGIGYVCNVIRMCVVCMGIGECYVVNVCGVYVVLMGIECILYCMCVVYGDMRIVNVVVWLWVYRGVHEGGVWPVCINFCVTYWCSVGV